jgi:ubiquinone biosynthesis protein Coq4
MFELTRNLATTIYDPRRADIRGGVDTLVRAAVRTATPQRLRELRGREPALAALHDAGYCPALDIDDLARLPRDTLGHHYAAFVRANGIDPLRDLIELTPSNLLEYTICRAYKLHDLMHVILGADTSVLGEVRIVAYSIGQARGEGGEAAELALAVLLLHLALRAPRSLPTALRLARQWRRVGAACRWHVALPLEDFVARPLADVRALVLSDPGVS